MTVTVFLRRVWRRQGMQVDASKHSTSFFDVRQQDQLEAPTIEARNTRSKAVICITQCIYATVKGSMSIHVGCGLARR